MTASVNQKDKILELVNSGEHEKALEFLSFIEEYWKEIEYDYKAKEIKERIAEDMKKELETATHWKAKKRIERILGKTK